MCLLDQSKNLMKISDKFMKFCFNILGFRSSLYSLVSYSLNCGSDSRGMLTDFYFYGLGQVMQNDLMLNMNL